MDKIINLAQKGQPVVEVDISTLTMVCFSQTGRRIMHYHTNGEHSPAENADAPFDQMTLLRRLQFAKSGFVLCSNAENTIIVDPEKVDYMIIEPSKTKGDVILSIGLPGMKTPYIIQTPADDALNMAKVLQRFYHPLSQALENGQTMLFRSAALRTARFKKDGQTVILDFDAAGEAKIVPIMQGKTGGIVKFDQGLRAAHQAAVGTPCSLLQRRLENAIDDLHVIAHANGTMLITSSSVIAAIAQDERDSKPRLLYLLDSKVGEPEIGSIEFDTAEERDEALALLQSGTDGFDGMDGMTGMMGNARHQVALKVMGLDGGIPPGSIIPALDDKTDLVEETPQPPTMPGRGQVRRTVSPAR